MQLPFIHCGSQRSLRSTAVKGEFIFREYYTILRVQFWYTYVIKTMASYRAEDAVSDTQHKEMWPLIKYYGHP